MFEITKDAHDKLLEMMEAHDKQGHALRVAIRGRGPGGFMYEMGFVNQENLKANDTVLDLDGIQVYVDPETVPNLDGSSLDYVENEYQHGFKIDNPNPLWRDPVAQSVQDVLDQQVNPAIAAHGGFISLQEVKDGVAYVTLGGGCQGCGMAKMTLSQGVVLMIKDSVPEITDVVDTTDHAAGTNPFYTPAAQGESPLAK